jgi:protein ImuB
MRLAAIDRSAQALGLTPGLTLADARSQVPGLVGVDSDPDADLDWLARLADGCLRYTPQVALAPPAGLILDITGCAHLFGGEGALADDATARLERLGMAVRAAFAGNPDAAYALARHQVAPAPDEAAAVRRLPVAALGLDADSELALRRAGLKTVGDVAGRPMAGLAARFGAAAVTAVQRLTGEAGSPLDPRRAAQVLSVERRFHEPIARTEDVLAVIAALAADAGQHLEERKLGGRRFEVLLFRVDGVLRRLMVETGLATRDPQAVMRLVRERIDSLDDPLDPGFGFDMVRLRVPVVQPLAATQLMLEGGHVADTQVAALIDRLSTRMGRGRVRRFAPADTHIPEQAQLMLPATSTGLLAWPTPEPGEPPLRPLHLFDPPQVVEVIAEVPDGPPHRFRWRRTLHEVARYEGPERIAAQWWRRKDGQGLTRDYYRVEDVRGRRYWLFRHGLYGERPDPRWYLHGLFA